MQKGKVILDKILNSDIKKNQGFSKEIKNFWRVISNSSSINRYIVKQNVDYIPFFPISSAEFYDLKIDTDCPICPRKHGSKLLLFSEIPPKVSSSYNNNTKLLSITATTKKHKIYSSVS